MLKIRIGKPSPDGPAMRMLQAIDRLSFVNPLDSREWVMDGIKVEASAVTNSRVRLSSIATLQPRTGAGSAGLMRLTALADVYGASLELSAVPYGDPRNTMAQSELSAWYVDRGGFSFRHAEDDEDMCRYPLTSPGAFYGLAVPTTGAIDDAFLRAVGLESLRASDGGFMFRGDAGAVDQLLQHSADFRLLELYFREDDLANVPVPKLSYAQRIAETACMRWQCETPAPEMPIEAAQRRLEELRKAPIATPGVVLRKARRSEPSDSPALE